MIDRILNHGGTLRYLFSDDLKGYFPSNPSCTVYNNKLVVNIRLLDYFYPAHFGKFAETTSRNFIGTMDSNMIALNGIKMPDVIGAYRYNNIYKGREDIRLVSWNGKLYGYCARPDYFEGCVIMEILEFDNSFNANTICVLGSSNGVEKNWMAIEDEPFRFIYDNNRTTMIEVGRQSSNMIMRKDAGIEASGGTIFIPYKNGHLGVVHRHIDWPIYEHNFILYDNQWNIVCESGWFKFSPFPIEFAMGLCIYNNQIVLTLSEYDISPQMLTIPFETMDWILGLSEEPNISYGDWVWQPDYIGDIYQDVSYQLYKRDLDRLKWDLNKVGIESEEVINKLKLYV